jgi:hypothetical protein
MSLLPVTNLRFANVRAQGAEIVGDLVWTASAETAPHNIIVEIRGGGREVTLQSVLGQGSIVLSNVMLTRIEDTGRKNAANGLPVFAIARTQAGEDLITAAVHLASASDSSPSVGASYLHKANGPFDLGFTGAFSFAEGVLTIPATSGLYLMGGEITFQPVYLGPPSLPSIEFHGETVLSLPTISGLYGTLYRAVVRYKSPIFAAEGTIKTFDFEYAPEPPPLPVITSPLTSSTRAGFKNWSYRITARNSAAFSVDVGALPLQFNSFTGELRGTFGTAGTYVVEISATNSTGTTTEELTITVVAALEPVLTSSQTPSAVLNEPFGYFLTARDHSALRADVSAFPTLQVLNGLVTKITGYFNSLGSKSIPVVMTDENGDEHTDTIVFTVSGVAPVFTSPENQGSVPSGIERNFSVQARGAEDFDVTLPAGMEGFQVRIIKDEGAPLPRLLNIAGMFNSGGTYEVEVEATNVVGSTTQTLTITVVGITAKSVTQAAQKNALARVPLISSRPAEWTFTDDPAPEGWAIRPRPVPYDDPVRKQAALDDLARRLVGRELSREQYLSAVDSINATHELVGTPTADGKLVIGVTATAIGSADTATATVTFLVQTAALPQTKLIWNPGWLNDGLAYQVGDAVSVALTSDPAEASWSARALPPGLTIDAATGLLSGVLTTAGRFLSNFVATAENYLPSAPGVLTFTVRNADTPSVPPPADATTPAVRRFPWLADEWDLLDVQILARQRTVQSTLMGTDAKTGGLPVKVGDTLKFAIFFIGSKDQALDLGMTRLRLTIRPENNLDAALVFSSQEPSVIRGDKPAGYYLITAPTGSKERQVVEAWVEDGAKNEPLPCVADVDWKVGEEHFSSASFPVLLSLDVTRP